MKRSRLVAGAEKEHPEGVGGAEFVGAGGYREGGDSEGCDEQRTCHGQSPPVEKQGDASREAYAPVSV